MHRNGLILMCLAYPAVAVLAGLVWYALPDAAPWLRTSSAAFAGTGLLWLIGLLRRSPSVYDAFWPVAPMLVAAAWALDHASAGACVPRQLLLLSLVCAWGLRLGYHWWSTFPGLDHEDWRYTDMRRSSGALFPLVNLLVIHLAPTGMLLLACAAMYPAMVTGTRPLGLLDLLAALWTLAAILLEATADRDMRAFRASPHPPGQVHQTGLWAWTRHPNYLGEMAFWWGVWLFSLAAEPPSSWATSWASSWAAAGPLVITAMFVFYSAPALDRRMLARAPAYRDYIARVPSLLPRRPR